MNIYIELIGTGVAALALFKGYFEFRLQGKQKRAELLSKLIERSKTDSKILEINSFLEKDNQELSTIPRIDRYHYLGFYEEIAIAVNSKLINMDVAFYMFGYFAMRCWESEKFWIDIDKSSYYWTVFSQFVGEMQALEKRNVNKKKFIKLWDIVTGRNIFRY